MIAKTPSLQRLGLECVCTYVCVYIYIMRVNTLETPSLQRFLYVLTRIIYMYTHTYHTKYVCVYLRISCRHIYLYLHFQRHWLFRLYHSEKGTIIRVFDSLTGKQIQEVLNACRGWGGRGGTYAYTNMHTWKYTCACVCKPHAYA